ncbi:MAG: LysE family translocator [Paracoccaceae bacterium]
MDLALSFDPVILAGFIAASIALYLTPGADMMVISAAGAAGGMKAGIAAALGVSLGSQFHVALAAAGVAALIAAHPLAYDALRLIGAGYLAFLAWRSWHARPPGRAGPGEAGAWRAFRRGAATNILNPKVSLFVLAFLPQFVDPARGPIWAQIAALGLIFGLGSVPFNCSYGALAGVLAARLRRSGRLLNRFSAVVFGGLAARLAFD